MPEYSISVCGLITLKQKKNLARVKTIFKHPVLKLNAQQCANILDDDDDDDDNDDDDDDDLFNVVNTNFNRKFISKIRVHHPLNRDDWTLYIEFMISKPLCYLHCILTSANVLLTFNNSCHTLRYCREDKIMSCSYEVKYVSPQKYLKF